MTFREKLQQEHPEKCNDCAIGGCDNCPSTYGYEPPKGKDGEDICEEFYNAYDNEDALCTKCWDREIPEAEPEKGEVLMNITSNGGMGFAKIPAQDMNAAIKELQEEAEKAKDLAAGDPVNAPSHYNAGGYECWDVMEAVFGKEAVYHFALCNAFKYLWRAGKKDDLVQDLKKAAKNLEKAISVLEDKV